MLQMTSQVLSTEVEVMPAAMEKYILVDPQEVHLSTCWKNGNVPGYVLHRISLVHTKLFFRKLYEQDCQFLITGEQAKELRLKSEYLI